MELLKGGELFDKIVNKQLYGEKDACKYMRQILSAVAYCHQQHIVHKDIKPENVLFECNEENSPIKVIDFGTSQFFEPSKKMKTKQGTAYYVAPEVLKKNYNEKCDVWSCGIIMYIILSGKPPFYGKVEQEIISQVESGIIDYDIPELRNVSPDGRKLLKEMTEYNPAKRISSISALTHPWFQKSKEYVNSKSAANILQNLQSFRATTKMEQAVCMYITTHLISNKEKGEMRKVFESMDANHDGQLSKGELIEGYTKISHNKQEAEQIVDDIMATADPDGNGVLDYTEFLVATVNRQMMLSDEKLKATFDQFDQDGSGYITPEEVKCMLGFGKQISESAWYDLVKQVDENGDGKISYEEFKTMMTKFAEINAN